VFLLTATPVNNSIHDFRHILELFTNGNETYFASRLGIPVGTSPESLFVIILDPATGTATFLVEVIDVIYRTMQAKWKQQSKYRTLLNGPGVDTMYGKGRFKSANHYPSPALQGVHLGVLSQS
jgi:hypothetical protein